MIVVFGANGNTGKVVAETLLGRGEKVRVVARDAKKVEALAQKGAEVVTADVLDEASVAKALAGAKGAYMLVPPDASSDDLVEAWGGPIRETIELFGADRCMFESNFPVDKVSGSYATYWNAFKRLAAGASATEKAALFRNTAARIYRLG